MALANQTGDYMVLVMHDVGHLGFRILLGFRLVGLGYRVEGFRLGA